MKYCIDINLRYFEYPMGASYRYGDVFVTMVCGVGGPVATQFFVLYTLCFAELFMLNVAKSACGGLAFCPCYSKSKIWFCKASIPQHPASTAFIASCPATYNARQSLSAHYVTARKLQNFRVFSRFPLHSFTLLCRTSVAGLPALNRRRNGAASLCK